MKKKTLLYLKMIAFVVILVILDQISKFVATANLMGKSGILSCKVSKEMQEDLIFSNV